MAQDADRWERICEKCFSKGCGECKKEGFITERGRPAGHLTPEGMEYFTGYRMLKSYGLLPAPGTWPEQTALFIDAVELCDEAVALHAERRSRKNEQAEKQAERLRRIFGGGASRA